jgi:hypothetical protein
MNTVVLLGTEHPIQLGAKAPNVFRAVLVDICKKNNVKAIADEINKGDNSIASRLAIDFPLIKYLYADPDIKERMDWGIPTSIELDIVNDFGDQYPNIRMWPQEPSRDNLPADVWKEYFKRTEDANRMRERVWLEKIRNFNSWPLLFICGTNHFDEFSKLLKACKFHVIETHKHWKPI